MNKTWKIILLTIASLITLVVLLVGGLLWWAGRAMEAISQEIYGGPIPPKLATIAALKIEDYQFTILNDKIYHNQLWLILGPKIMGEEAFSTTKIDKEFKAMAKLNAEMDKRLKKLDTALPAGFAINGQFIKTLQFESEPGVNNEAGILNLDNSQLLFVVSGPFRQGDSAHAKLLISDIPRILNDSHIRQSKQSEKDPWANSKVRLKAF